MSNQVRAMYDFYVPSIQDDVNLRALKPGHFELPAPTLENDSGIIKIEGKVDKNHMTTVVVDVADVDHSGSAITISRKDNARLQAYDYTKDKNQLLFGEDSNIRSITIQMTVPQCWEADTDYHDLNDVDDAYAFPRFLGVIGLCANAMQLGMTPKDLNKQQEPLATIKGASHCALH